MTSVSRIHLWLTLVVVAAWVSVAVEARGSPFGLFAFPQTRRGRATPTLKSKTDNSNKVLSFGGNSDDETSAILDSITISKDASEEDEIIQKLVDSLVKEAMLNSGANVPQEQPRNNPGHFKPQFFQNNGQPRLPPTTNYANVAAMPRNVDAMSQFGSNIETDFTANTDHLPQLVNRQLLNDAAPAVMNLGRDGTFSRQADGAEVDNAGDNGAAAASDDEIRCIPKVMQVEETVYDRAIKCHHSYQEKCHMTYITDYRSTTQEKCETTFKKNCHITFLPMPFNESVNICHTPIVRKCGDKAVGPDICSTHYETNCETKYKTYEVEQDEPVCRMELMRKCKDVTIRLPTADPSTPRLRQKRQFEGLDDGSEANSDSESTDVSTDNSGDEGDGSGDDGNTVKVDESCEEWPVQKCELIKKTVRKVHPETECRKIPREVCVPNHCAMQQGDEICRDEVRMQVQNVPQEECELQPEENCHAEAVLVPRLVPKPNCVKVPKEICVNTKSNPRRVKKPVVKEWCYRPSDLLDNSPSISHQTPDVSGNEASGFFARRNKYFNF